MADVTGEQISAALQAGAEVDPDKLEAWTRTATGRDWLKWARMCWLSDWEARLSAHNDGAAEVAPTNTKARALRDTGRKVPSIYDMLGNLNLFRAYASPELIDAVLELGFEHYSLAAFTAYWAAHGTTPPAHIPSGSTRQSTAEHAERARHADWVRRNG